MNKDLARYVVASAFRSMHELEHLIDLLKPHCDQAEYETYLKGIAAALGAISANILSKVFASYPELEREVEDRINTYGKFI